MAYRVIVDAGHGGRDPGAVYSDRKEKDDTLALALELGSILEQNGIDTVYTRTTDIYQTPYEKAQIGNQSGADLFVSLHRNASADPGSASGVETLVYDQTGDKVEIAENINEQLASLGFANRGVISRPGLVVLRRTNLPAVLVEAGFIDNEADNERFDSQFSAVAQSIADGILETIQAAPAGGQTWQVQVGAFRVRELATQQQNQLLQEGFPAYILYTDGLYKVQVGSYPTMEAAVQAEKQLRAAGYSTFLTS